MAAVSTGSLSISTWINEKNALAAYKGLPLNRYWESWVKSDNVKQTPTSDLSYAGLVTCHVSYRLFTTFSRVEHILSPERVTAYAWGFFPDPRGPYFYAALLLTVLNGAKFVNEAMNPATHSAPTGMDKFLVVVSKATPYLMIITNIAVTIIQIRRGDGSSAWITLALTGITLIDITSWKPKEYAWYRDILFLYPVGFIALYYVGNFERFRIINNLAINAALSNQAVNKQVTEIGHKILTISNKIRIEMMKTNQKTPWMDRVNEIIEKEFDQLSNRLGSLLSTGWTSR